MTGLLLAAVAAASVATAPVSGVSPQERRRALFLTDLLMEDGRLDEAEAFVHERMPLDDDRDSWLTRLARIRAAQKRHAESADIYRDMLARRGEDAGLLIQLGLQEFAAGDLPAAELDLERARARSTDPMVLYYLSELAYARDDGAKGREFAEKALAKMNRTETTSQKRVRLRLRSRLGYTDSLHDDYGKLHEADPKESEVLTDWVDALHRAGLHEESAEPLALLEERFPAERRRWRKLVGESLKRSGRDAERAAFLAESVREFPEDESLRMALGDSEMGERRWERARVHLTRVSSSPAYGRWATELLDEVRREGDNHAGPFFRWRDSRSARVVEAGAAGRGYVRERLRLEAEASRLAVHSKSRGTREAPSGGNVLLLHERRRWNAGGDLDVRAGGGLGSVSPGARWSWRPSGPVFLEASAFLRRAWLESVEAVSAAAKADEASFGWRLRPLKRLAFTGEARVDRITVQGGGTGSQLLVTPGLAVTLLERPFYAAAGWRTAILDASGNAAFFAALPLQKRARAHYGTLSVGKSFLRGRLRTDAYVYNGHDPERGRNFGSFDLYGWGANVAADAGPVAVAAGWSTSRDDEAGAGGVSRSGRLMLQWRWAPRPWDGRP